MRKCERHARLVKVVTSAAVEAQLVLEASLQRHCRLEYDGAAHLSSHAAFLHPTAGMPRPLTAPVRSY